MLEQVLNHLHNWFVVEIRAGEYTIENGQLALPFLQPGQYYRIVDSVFNNGLHLYSQDSPPLKDETFNGAVWALTVPDDVVTLAEEMGAWQEKNGAAAQGLYQSESFGGYSYSKIMNSTGGVVTVWDVFRPRLKPYQKLCGMW